MDRFFEFWAKRQALNKWFHFGPKGKRRGIRDGGGAVGPSFLPARGFLVKPRKYKRMLPPSCPAPLSVPPCSHASTPHAAPPPHSSLSRAAPPTTISTPPTLLSFLCISTHELVVHFQGNCNSTQQQQQQQHNADGRTAKQQRSFERSERHRGADRRGSSEYNRVGAPASSTRDGPTMCAVEAATTTRETTQRARKTWRAAARLAARKSGGD